MHTHTLPKPPMKAEIIETYWNVNTFALSGSSNFNQEIIETYWNVNLHKFRQNINKMTK